MKSVISRFQDDGRESDVGHFSTSARRYGIEKTVSNIKKYSCRTTKKKDSLVIGYLKFLSGGGRKDADFYIKKSAFWTTFARTEISYRPTSSHIGRRGTTFVRMGP